MIGRLRLAAPIDMKAKVRDWDTQTRDLKAVHAIGGQSKHNLSPTEENHDILGPWGSSAAKAPVSLHLDYTAQTVAKHLVMDSGNLGK